MSDIYFNDRKGQTVLSHSEKDGLLLNHITNLAELDEAEQENIQEGLIWLAGYKREFFSETFWRKLHKELFGQVWKWAGTYRKSAKNIGIEYWNIPVEISKLIEDLKVWIEKQAYEYGRYEL